MKKETFFFMLTAIIMGFFGALLSIYGNPINTGICISCFMENFSGALKLHNNIFMQYIRPELLYIVPGSLFMALIRKEFNANISLSIIHSFLGGVFMIIGSAVFIGCPIKMFLRLAGGDLNSIAGILGTVFGVFLGISILKEGIDTTSFKIIKKPNKISALIIPLSIIFLIVVYHIKGELFFESESGAGSERAPYILSAMAGLFLGGLSQYSRFCITGSIRNSLILKNFIGFLALILLTTTAMIINIFAGKFNLGFIGQPGSHTKYAWSFISMGLVGYIAVLIDGCPFRQIVKMGEGNINSQVSFLGMLLASAFVQNFNILSDASGPTNFGKFAIVIGILIFSIFTLELLKKNE